MLEFWKMEYVFGQIAYNYNITLCKYPIWNVKSDGIESTMFEIQQNKKYKEEENGKILDLLE